MIEKIVELILALLRLIPIVDSWFRKAELDKEKDARKDVEKEHEKNKETGRPSNEFWDKRGL